MELVKYYHIFALRHDVGDHNKAELIDTWSEMDREENEKGFQQKLAACRKAPENLDIRVIATTMDYAAIMKAFEPVEMDVPKVGDPERGRDVYEGNRG